MQMRIHKKEYRYDNSEIEVNNGRLVWKQNEQNCLTL